MNDSPETVAPAANQEVMTRAEAPVVVVEAANETGNLMNLIATMARDGADMNRIERLIALREQMIATEAKRKFDADFVDMKPNLPRVVSVHNNTQTRSKYAKLEDINVIIDPILGKHGFGTSAKVKSQNDKTVTMVLQLRHRDGHYDEMELTMPIDNAGAQGGVNKTMLHGISSTITYIKRVGFCAMLNISTGDDKDGNVESDFIDVTQAADIDNRARAFGDEYYKKFLTFMQVDVVTGIAKKDYKKAVTQLKSSEDEAKRRKAKAASDAAGGAK